MVRSRVRGLPFAVPMIWHEPTDHVTDCYFCMTSVVGFSIKTQRIIKYPDCRSALKPVPHDDKNPKPKPPEQYSCTEVGLQDISVESTSSSDDTVDPPFMPDYEDLPPHKLNQGELNDLCRDLALPKGKSELLASRLQQWNMLQRDATVTSLRHRHEAFAIYFKKVDDLSYCTDITGLMEHMNGSYDPHNWRLFIDSGKGMLKAVLVHNGNIKPSVPLAHTAKMKEEYESMKLLLDLIKYTAHGWYICADLKVVAILTGLQTGYTKHVFSMLMGQP